MLASLVSFLVTCIVLGEIPASAGLIKEKSKVHV